MGIFSLLFFVFAMESPWSGSKNSPIIFIKYEYNDRGIYEVEREVIFPDTFLLSVVDIYTRYISPMFGKGKCRYYISCSNYARESIKRYGFLRGFFMSVDRVMRCHQFQQETRDDPPYAWW